MQRGNSSPWFYTRGPSAFWRQGVREKRLPPLCGVSARPFSPLGHLPHSATALISPPSQALALASPAKVILRQWTSVYYEARDSTSATTFVFYPREPAASVYLACTTTASPVAFIPKRIPEQPLAQGGSSRPGERGEGVGNSLNGPMR